MSMPIPVGRCDVPHDHTLGPHGPRCGDPAAFAYVTVEPWGVSVGWLCETHRAVMQIEQAQPRGFVHTRTPLRPGGKA